MSSHRPTLLVAAALSVVVVAGVGCSSDDTAKPAAAKKATTTTKPKATTTTSAPTSDTASTTSTSVDDTIPPTGGTATPGGPTTPATQPVAPPTAPPKPPKKLDDSGFADAADKVSKTIDAAGTDTCKLTQAVQSLNLPAPSTAAQGKTSVDLYVRVINALASSLPPNLAPQGNALHTAMAALASETSAKGYDPGQFSKLAALSDPAYTEALVQVFKANLCAK